MDKKLSASGGFSLVTPTRDCAPGFCWGLHPHADPLLGLWHSPWSTPLPPPFGKSWIQSELRLYSWFMKLWSESRVGVESELSLDLGVT